MVKKPKNINPSCLLRSPHQQAAPGTDPTVVNCRTTDCLPAAEKQATFAFSDNAYQQMHSKHPSARKTRSK